MSEKAEGGGGGGGGGDDDDHEGTEDKPKRVHVRHQRTGGYIKARALLLRPIKKLQARRDHNHHQQQQQQPPRPPYDEDFVTTGCHLCFMPPSCHRSPNRRASTDGSKPPSYHEFLRSLLEKNDFYSPECNVHRELAQPVPAMDGIEVLHKRMKTTEGSEGDGGVEASGEEAGMGAGSPEMEANIQRILEKIEGFTNRVSEMLEAGKTLFRDLTTDFEDRLIAIHREHIEKWQEEIKQLRMIDASNEATRARLQNAQLHILQSVRED